MKIIPAKQLSALDRATAQKQGITSIQLMERAATAVFDRLQANEGPWLVLCGPGNNGGDGYVIARKLLETGAEVTVLELQIGERSPDNQANRQRFITLDRSRLETLRTDDAFPAIPSDATIIDAVFGSGLNRPVTGYWARFFDHLNATGNKLIAVDLPSGVVADAPTKGAYLRAATTYSLGTPKLAEAASDNAAAYGEIVHVPIGLDRDFIEATPTIFSNVAPTQLADSLKNRGTFEHKGTFGHALIVAGSHGKIGAAILSARAALRAGAGLVTVHLPRCGYEIMQISFPEAMCRTDRHRFIVTEIEEVDQYTSCGIGPGLGTNQPTVRAVQQFLEDVQRPIVVDADALNIISECPDLLHQLPANSILTPHPKEFERLAGPSENDFERWQQQLAMAGTYGIIVIVKGGRTAIALPDGRMIFNVSGNAGMGTAGTGDVLTGILTGLLAQDYPPDEAAQVGVYLHGLAGDLAVKDLEMESLLASDVISYLGRAFARLRSKRDR